MKHCQKCNITYGSPLVKFCSDCGENLNPQPKASTSIVEKSDSATCSTALTAMRAKWLETGKKYHDEAMDNEVVDSYDPICLASLCADFMSDLEYLTSLNGGKENGSSSSTCSMLRVIEHPMITNGGISTDALGLVILVDKNQTLDQKAVTVWHEIIHLLKTAGNTPHNEAMIESTARVLAEACPEVTEWVGVSKSNVKLTRRPSDGTNQ